LPTNQSTISLFNDGKSAASSANRWQHGFQICFGTLFNKNHIIAKNSTITKAIEKYAQIWNP